MRTVSKEITIVLHLYTSEPDRFQIPATIEYGEDIEFNENYRGRILEDINHTLYHDYKDFKFNGEESLKTVLLTRYIYEHKEYDVQFIVNILTDSNPWPQKDPDECFRRKELADNGALGQSWWIHHITLPDGTVIDDCDKIRKSVRDQCVAAVKAEIDKFLDEEDLK